MIKFASAVLLTINRTASEWHRCVVSHPSRRFIAAAGLAFNCTASGWGECLSVEWKTYSKHSRCCAWNYSVIVLLLGKGRS